MWRFGQDAAKPGIWVEGECAWDRNGGTNGRGCHNSRRPCNLQSSAHAAHLFSLGSVLTSSKALNETAEHITDSQQPQAPQPKAGRPQAHCNPLEFDRARTHSSLANLLIATVRFPGRGGMHFFETSARAGPKSGKELQDSESMGCFWKFGVHFLGVLTRSALLLGVYIRAPDIRKL